MMVLHHKTMKIKLRQRRIRLIVHGFSNTSSVTWIQYYPPSGNTWFANPPASMFPSCKSDSRKLPSLPGMAPGIFICVAFQKCHHFGIYLIMFVKLLDSSGRYTSLYIHKENVYSNTYSSLFQLVASCSCLSLLFQCEHNHSFLSNKGSSLTKQTNISENFILPMNL